MKKENFKKMASRQAVINLTAKCLNKYNMTEDRAKRYVDYALDSVARSQAGEAVGWDAEAATLYYDYAMTTLIKAKNKNQKANKKLLFLVEICVRVNDAFLSELTLAKGEYNSALNVYNSWKHITFNNGDVLYSSCGGGRSWDNNAIYNNFLEFVDVVISANPSVLSEPNKEAIKKGIKEQSKRIGL